MLDSKKRQKPPQGYYFGDYESSFSREIKHKQLIPGVGEYNIDNTSHMNNSIQSSGKQVPSIPQSKRFQVYDPKTPGPNQYKLLPSVNNIPDNKAYMTQQTQSTKQNTQNTLQSTFLSTAKRTDNIFGIMNQSNVGPGQYNLPSSFDNKNLSKTPNFKLYEHRKFKLIDQDIPGVGSYNIPEVREHVGAKMSQGERDFHKLVTSRSQVAIPGVGQYHNPSYSDFAYKKGTKGTVFGQEERQTFGQQNKNNPGPTTYNLPSEDKYKFSQSVQYSISTFKNSIFDQSKKEVTPSPFEYQDKYEDSLQGHTFQQSQRPNYELYNTNPGIGTYNVAQNIISKNFKDKNQDVLENKQVSEKLQKVLITKKKQDQNQQQTGSIDNKKKRNILNKQKQILDYATKQNLDQKQLQRYLNTEMNTQELEKFLSPHPGEYKPIESIRIKRVGRGENIQSKSVRKLEFLDVYNKPQFGERSQGPAVYSKINNMESPDKTDIYTFFKSDKQSFVVEPTTSKEVGVGKYNDKEFSTFGKYQKQVEKIENFKKLDYQKRQFINKLDMEKKSKQYALEKQKEEEKSKLNAQNELKSPKLSQNLQNSHTDFKFDQTSQQFLEQDDKNENK